MLLNIFIRLRAKQLAQMRCLSKSWNALLSESSFIKSHLDRSILNNNKDGIFLIFPPLFCFDSKPFTARPYQSPHLELTNFIKLPVPQPENSRGQIIGSVNGLICFKHGSNHNPKFFYGSDSKFIYGSDHHSEVIYIWNPSLSALLTLPPYFMPSHSIQHSFRFGFDPKTNDYKVVKITRRLSTSSSRVVCREWLLVEVYSMRKGSWKLTTQTFPSHFKGIYDFDYLCADGHVGYLHWHGGYYYGNLATKTIVAFDLGAETFHEISIPDSVIGDNMNKFSITIGILAGKLCVISNVHPDDECVVWVMDEYGVAESWVKHHVFPRFRDYIRPYGFTLQKEFFIYIRSRVLGWNHALYDPVAAKTKIINSGNSCFLKFVDYIDSLVWVTPAEQREKRCCSISQFQF